MNEQKKGEVVVKKNHKWIIPIVALFVILFVALIIFFYKINSNGKDNRLQEQLDLGAKYLSELDYAQAIVAYDTAIQIDPMSMDAYLGLASVYEAQGEYEKAIAILQEGYDKTSDDVFLDKIEQLKNVLKSNCEENNSDNYLAENVNEEYILIDEDGDGKHDPDVEALKSIINEQVAFGALVDTDLDSIQYSWKDGRLIGIEWVNMNLKGNISFVGLAEMQSLICATSYLDSSVGTYENWKSQNCSFLDGINISENTKLTFLDCTGNNITELDVQANQELQKIYCGYNKIEILNLNNNRKLTYLYCSQNKLMDLNVNRCVVLADLYCAFNVLTNLDISNNDNLIRLNCANNLIAELDVSNNMNLAELYCGNNILTSLDISSNRELFVLYCDNNNLSILDVTNNIELVDLGCSDNQLTGLDISNNKKLEYLSCAFNQLTSIDISNNDKLEHVTVENSVSVIMN